MRLTFVEAGSSHPACVISQTLDGQATTATTALAPATVLSEAAIVRDAAHPIVVQTVRTAEGLVWREATSLVQDRRVVIRLADPDHTTLVRMVRSLRRGRV